MIAGTAYGLTSPVKTYSPMFYAHLDLRAGASGEVCGGHSERAVYVAAGRAQIEGATYEHGQMIVLAPGSMPVLKAVEPSTIMLLGAEPIGPRYIWWNFVSSRRERIEQAKADWRAGRIALPVGDDAELIPLPEAPPSKPEPMS